MLQEAFVRVWSRAETYEARLGSPAAWLTRIARNRAIDRLRARQVRQDVDAPPPPEPETLARRAVKQLPNLVTSLNLTSGLGAIPGGDVAAQQAALAQVQATLPPLQLNPDGDMPPISGSTYEFPTLPGMKFEDFAKDPDRASRNMAHQVITEFMRKR
mgnify:CR=1 FL=1